MKPNMDNIRKKIEENRDLIDRITVKLPGFSGYVEKAERYAADRIIRNLLAERLQVFKSDLNATMSSLEKKEERANLPSLDALGTKLETLVKKCSHADFGVSASVSDMKISEEDKNRLLEYDWSLISALDGIEKGVADILSGDAKMITDAVPGLEKKLRDFEKNFDARKNVLLEVL